MAERVVVLTKKAMHDYLAAFAYWIQQSRRDQTQLASLTQYIRLEGDTKQGKPMPKETASRVVSPRKEIPTKGPAFYALMKLVGVLYILGVLSKEQIVYCVLYEWDVRVAKKWSWDRYWETLDAVQEQIKAEADQMPSPRLKRRYELVIDPPKYAVEPPPMTLREMLAEGLEEPLFDGMRVHRLNTVALLVMAVGALLMLLVWSAIESSGVSGPKLTLTPPVSPTPAVLEVNCGQVFTQIDPVLAADQGVSTYTPATGGASLLDGNIRSIGVNAQGVWVGYSQQNSAVGKISLLNGQEWVHCDLGDRVTANQVANAIAFDSGHTYVAFDGAGVARFDGTDWVFYGSSDGLVDQRVYDLNWFDGDLWAPTWLGVAQLTDSGWTEWKPGLAEDGIHTFLVDSQGNEWLGYIEKGIERVDPQGNVVSYFADDPLRRNIRRSVEDSQGGVWFATAGGGMLRFVDGEWQTFTAEDSGLPGDDITDVEIDQFGRIWASSRQGIAYSSDFGQTWTVHSTLPVLDIEFGCVGCSPYDENHLWMVIESQGLGHARIPPEAPTVEVVSAPEPKVLEPGEQYVFEVQVSVVAGELLDSRGDMLVASVPSGAELYGAWPHIAVTGSYGVGETFTFSNEDNPIIAPAEPGVYRLPWRVWQAGRYVTQEIWIEFEVLEP